MATKKPAAPKVENKDAEAPAKAGLFVLKKNHGLIVHGRASKFYEAGSTFDPDTDGDLISQLVRSGAELEQETVVTEEVKQPDGQE